MRNINEQLWTENIELRALFNDKRIWTAKLSMRPMSHLYLDPRVGHGPAFSSYHFDKEAYENVHLRMPMSTDPIRSFNQ